MNDTPMDREALQNGYWMCNHGIVEYNGTWASTTYQHSKSPVMCSWILNQTERKPDIDGICEPWTPITIHQREARLCHE